MVKLQHETMRGPNEFISAAGVKYEIDADGCVEVSEEAAAVMLQGRKWRSKEYWDERRDKIAAATPPQTTSGGARRVRTRDELLATADAAGVVYEQTEEPVEKAIPAASTEAVQADAQAQAHADAELQGMETIEVSEDMTKKQLLQLAADAGIQVKQAMSKAEIIQAFKNASEE